MGEQKWKSLPFSREVKKVLLEGITPYLIFEKMSKNLSDEHDKSVGKSMMINSRIRKKVTMTGA